MNLIDFLPSAARRSLIQAFQHLLDWLWIEYPQTFADLEWNVLANIAQTDLIFDKDINSLHRLSCNDFGNVSSSYRINV